MSYKFSPKVEEKFQWLVTRYPKIDAILLPLLHEVQAEVGYLSVDAIDYVASRMGLSPARVREVASFYSMFKLSPTGKYNIQVCHNLSCHLWGAEDILKTLEDKLGIRCGETTPDGLFSIERVECLASCSTAPAMQINRWDYHESLNPQKVLKIIDDLKSGKCASESYEERIAQGSEA